MGALFQLLWWIASTTEFHNADNAYLNGLPPDIQAHLLAIGKWILQLMGWA